VPGVGLLGATAGFLRGGVALAFLTASPLAIRPQSECAKDSRD
jgi:hypothetical protein